MREESFKDYLNRPVPATKRVELARYFESPDTANRFLNSLDAIRRTSDISDWKKGIQKLVDTFDTDVTVPKSVLRDATTEAMDFKSMEALFGDLSGEYDDDAKSLAPTAKEMPKTYSRVTLMDNDLLSMARSSSRLKPASLPSVSFTPRQPISINGFQIPTHYGMSNAVNLDKHAIQVALQRERMEKIYPVVGRAVKLASEASMHAQKAVTKQVSRRPQLLFLQAAALAQKLFGEIARNPEAYVKLSQAETSAMSSSKISSAPIKTSDPKVALRMVAMNAMSQLYAPKQVNVSAIASAQLGVSSLQAAIKRVDDNRKKHEAKETVIEAALSKLGYSAEERSRLAPIIEKNAENLASLLQVRLLFCPSQIFNERSFVSPITAHTGKRLTFLTLMTASRSSFL
ncbi:MAG: hypothetical protein J0653_04015 [Deltaproteobacteria bacterium]|nr:hypothetical protein [Deltaproteobacteria bacterium]